ncbi:MAG: ABC transporter ATP-binding protein [Acutalibacteraceae bacterium]|nr:ABC transporter ATP-binding protein [Acutalibacteraceae bacterium]
MKALFRYLKPVAGRIAIGTVIKFVGSIMDLFLPYILAHLLDNVVPQAKEDGSLRMIFIWGAAMILCAAIAWISNIVANRIAASTSRDAIRDIRMDLFKKTICLSERQINDFSIPTLEMRLTGDTYNVHRMLGMVQRMGVRAPILLIGGVIMTFSMEPVLTCVLLAALPIIAFVIYTVSKKGIPLYDKVQRKTDGMVRIVRENIVGVRVIKALSKTEYEKERFTQINNEVGSSETTAGVVMATTSPIMNILLNGGMTAVILVGAFRINAGLTEPGTIIAFMTYFTIILNAMMMVTRLFVNSSKGVASMNRIAEVLYQKDEDELFAEAVGAPDIKTDAKIVFSGVSFSYNGKKDDLSDISFAVPRGGTLGIIGATGSGKTTLIKLLMRFYDPKEGGIYIDGRDIRRIATRQLREKFGIAMQNDFLYAGTVEENLNFERDIKTEDIMAAVTAAQGKDFIDQRGLDYELTMSGHNLSGGQRQRLLVARALAGKPEILILDDASSALDYKTDAALRNAIAGLDYRPTTVVIAQRVSSVMNSDVILLIDEGRIVDKGTHNELINRCEMYRDIAKTQMGGGV